MLMNPANFLIELGQLEAGQNIGGKGVGFLKTVPLPVTSLRTSGATLTSGTNPSVQALETNAIGVQWAAGDATAATLNFTVPYDYDENTDTLTIALMVNSAGNTDAPIMDATIYSKRAATALTADLDPTASSAIPKSATAATAAAERTIVLSGGGLKAGDVLSIGIFPGTHGSDAVNLYGITLRYSSTLVAFTKSLR